MLLSGNTLGAAAIARTQLERWSKNLSLAISMPQMAGESTADFFTRVWKAGHGDVPDAGQIWIGLSEVLHGRGDLLALARWDTIELSGVDPDDAVVRSTNLILDAVALSLLQVRHCALDAARTNGVPTPAGPLLDIPMRLPSTIWFKLSPTLCWPLNFVYLQKFGRQTEKAGAAYWADVRALSRYMEPPRTLAYSARALEAFEARRGRAVAVARMAFDLERSVLEDRFDAQVLSSRETGYTLVNESCGIASRWTSGPLSDALAVAASAFRAAYWLWLEDDDRSMALARTTLEQTARARAWRLKPDRARSLEQRVSRTTTRDWLQEAGWRRVSVLNRSLGEFAHASLNSKWSGARDVLERLQTGTELEEGVDPSYTVRGSVLNRLAILLGSEVRQQLSMVAPSLDGAFMDLLPVGDADDEDAIEVWLNHVWSFRSAGFGEPDLRPPASPESATRPV